MMGEVMTMAISASYKGVVKGNTVLLEKATELPDGTEVLVTPLEMVKGSPQAVLAALKASPPVSHEDVVELLRLIEEGKRPVRYDNPLTRHKRKGRGKRRALQNLCALCVFARNQA